MQMRPSPRLSFLFFKHIRTLLGNAPVVQVFQK